MTDVAPSGRKIKIKYDDGTSEVSDFPDKDIVVDAERNRRHRPGTSSGAFVPPPPPSLLLRPSPSLERTERNEDEEDGEGDVEGDEQQNSRGRSASPQRSHLHLQQGPPPPSVGRRSPALTTMATQREERSHSPPLPVATERRSDGGEMDSRREKEIRRDRGCGRSPSPLCPASASNSVPEEIAARPAVPNRDEADTGGRPRRLSPSMSTPASRNTDATLLLPMRATPLLPKAGLQKGGVVSTDGPTAVSESPFSPITAHNKNTLSEGSRASLSSSSSSSLSSAVRSGSGGLGGKPRKTGKIEGRSGSFDSGDGGRSGRKRGRSPITMALGEAGTKTNTVGTNSLGGAGSEAADRSAVSERPTLHIKLIPPRIKRPGGRATSAGTSVPPSKPRRQELAPGKVDDETGYLPSDGEELETRTERPMRIRSPPERSTGGSGSGSKVELRRAVAASAKRGTSPGFSDSSSEDRRGPLRKRIAVAVPLLPAEGRRDGVISPPFGVMLPVSDAPSVVSKPTVFSSFVDSEPSQKVALFHDQEDGVPSSREEFPQRKEQRRPKVSVLLRPTRTDGVANPEDRLQSLLLPKKARKKRQREERDRDRLRSPVPLLSRSPKVLRRENAASASDDAHAEAGRAGVGRSRSGKDSSSSRSGVGSPHHSTCVLSSREDSDSSSSDSSSGETASNEQILSPLTLTTSKAVAMQQTPAEGRVPTISIPIPQSGRRAVKRAAGRIKERDMVTKDEFLKQEPGRSDRRRKPKSRNQDLKLFPDMSFEDEIEVHNNKEDGNHEDRWVQCDRCEKWRLLPSSVDMEGLPERWYCELNRYDPKRNSCDAPEQTTREVEIELRARRKAREGRGASMRVSGAMSCAENTEMKEETNVPHRAKVGGKSGKMVLVHSPAGLKEKEPFNEAETEAEAAHGHMPILSGSVPRATIPVRAKESASKVSTFETSLEGGIPESAMPVGVELTADSWDGQAMKSSTGSVKKSFSMNDIVSVVPSDTASDAGSLAKARSGSRRSNKNRDHSSRQRDRDREGLAHKNRDDRSQGNADRERSSSKGSKDRGDRNSKKKEAEKQEWVQCEKCEKWRRLPPRISADDLPDTWYCSMNTWDPVTASCTVAEDKLDINQREYTVFNGAGAGAAVATVAGNGITPSLVSAGKLSYRSLIFGNGKRFHRPVSERTRAAESLFSGPPSRDSSTDNGGPPTVMYANSSAFICKGSQNMHRSGGVGPPEENVRVSFLDIMSHSELWSELYRGAKTTQALSTGKPSYSTVVVHHDLGDEQFSRSMKSLVLRALGSGTLTGHEVLLEAQCRQWDDGKWADLRASCTLENITYALENLVNEGRVEVIQGKPKCGARRSLVRYCRSKVTLGEGDKVSIPARKPTVNNGKLLVQQQQSKGSRCMKISKPWKTKRVGSTPVVENQWCS